jgi:hypothetical protein
MFILSMDKGLSMLQTASCASKGFVGIASKASTARALSLYFLQSFLADEHAAVALVTKALPDFRRPVMQSYYSTHITR